jgi:hypothetical protein
MTGADRLIEEIMAAARIPSGKRRSEVLRELRAHIEDFAQEHSGMGGSEIERVLRERFGDPRQVAEQFAWVYRRERAAWHLGGFLLSTVVVSLIMAVTAIAIHTAIMAGFGSGRGFNARHSASVALDILATAATYLGLISLGRFFARPLMVLAAIAAALFVVFMAAGLPSQYIVFGFVNGALLYGVQLADLHPSVRLFAALACFAALGAIFFHPSSSAVVATATSWMIMGSAYHLMTRIAARVDRAVLGRL